MYGNPHVSKLSVWYYVDQTPKKFRDVPYKNKCPEIVCVQKMSGILQYSGHFPEYCLSGILQYSGHFSDAWDIFQTFSGRT